MTRYITNEEQRKLDDAQREAFQTEQSRRDAIEAAQSRVDREHADRDARLRVASRALIFMAIAVLALTVAAFLGWYDGGRP